MKKFDESTCMRLAKMVRSSARKHQLVKKSRCPYSTKEDGGFVTQMDLSMQSNLERKLRKRWPEISFLSEEMSHAEQMQVLSDPGQGYWILDPLDGTTNYSLGFPIFGISLALVIASRVVLGVVYDPVRKECFSAVRGCGAYLDGRKITTQGDKPMQECIANIDYKRLFTRLSEQLIRCPPFRSQRNLGSSVLEWCWLAAGRTNLYLHGGQKLWDIAAGSLILEEAGGFAHNIYGEQLLCSTLAKQSVIAAADSILMDQWSAWILQNLSHDPRQASHWPPSSMIG